MIAKTITLRSMIAIGLVCAGPASARAADDARIAAILKSTPLIDGHDDWAESRQLYT